jgi:hypothetical protein
MCYVFTQVAGMTKSVPMLEMFHQSISRLRNRSGISHAMCRDSQVPGSRKLIAVDAEFRT